LSEHPASAHNATAIAAHNFVTALFIVSRLAAIRQTLVDHAEGSLGTNH
jgi:hypothetical protein